MKTVVKTRLVRIGNAHHVRIRKLFLEQTRLHDDVERELQHDQIIIRSTRRVREGWETAFQAMAQQGDDQLLDGNTLPETTWDAEEWTQ